MGNFTYMTIMVKILAVANDEMFRLCLQCCRHRGLIDPQFLDIAKGDFCLNLVLIAFKGP